MTNVMSSLSGCSNEGFSAVIERGDEVISAAEAVTRSGGSVLKALSAAEGALPREHEYEAARYILLRQA